MPKLSVSVEGARTTHELTDEKITIGRAPDNLIQAAAAVAVLAFLVSMFGLLQIHGPR